MALYGEQSLINIDILLMNILMDPEESDDWFDFAEHVFVNKIIGFIVLAIIFWICAKL